MEDISSIIKEPFIFRICLWWWSVSLYHEGTIWAVDSRGGIFFFFFFLCCIPISGSWKKNLRFSPDWLVWDKASQQGWHQVGAHGCLGVWLERPCEPWAYSQRFRYRQLCVTCRIPAVTCVTCSLGSAEISCLSGPRRNFLLICLVGLGRDFFYQPKLSLRCDVEPGCSCLPDILWKSEWD